MSAVERVEMYASALRRLLELYPAGASGDQLLWRLRSSGSRASAADILQGLNELSGNGEIRIGAGDRWVLTRFLETGRGTKEGRPAPGPEEPTGRVLRAAFGTVTRIDEREPGVDDGGGGPVWPLSSYRRELLAYYAATQRTDPRGRVSQFPDRHGIAWHLVTFVGEWWRNARLLFPLTNLEEGFREALLKRTERTCAVGYPLSLVETSNGTEIRPALIQAAVWTINDENLLVDIGAEQPVLNPDWLKSACSKYGWKADALHDALFQDGEDGDLDAVVRRLRPAMARAGGGALTIARPDDSVTLGRTGLRNAAAVFLSTDRSYVQGTAADLQTIAEAAAEDHRQTALESLFTEDAAPPPEPDTADLLQLRDLTESQFKAAASILTAPLTVVSGPPGTGKSDVIVSVIASALATGRTVLFASRNHQALDEVENRLGAIVGEIPVLIRGRDAEGDRDTNFLAELKALAAAAPLPAGLSAPDETALGPARAATRDKQRLIKRTRLEFELAGLLEALDRLAPDPSQTGTPALPKPGPLHRLLDALRRLVRQLHKFGASEGSYLSSPSTIQRQVEYLRAKIAELGSAAVDMPSADEADVLRVMDALRPFFLWRTMADEDERETLAANIKELEFNGLTTSRRLLAEDARLLLQRRPVWVVSTLSVPSRIPLVPGLFDLLVIDEASQCDIASALPLFYRARRAAVVGDPMQLSFIPQLSLQQEHALMTTVGLPKPGRSRIAQSVNSLFDFADRRPAAVRQFLSDQFRSAPGIIDYLNDEFYRGRLVARRDDESVAAVPGYKPGLEWVHVEGRASRLDDQNVNIAEAEEVVRRVVRLARDTAFSGTVGVLSPFVGQVGEISKRVSSVLTPTERDRIKLKIATIDKFQGGEADVILFSLVLSEGGGFGPAVFLRRERKRFNVAVSRAKAVCVVVGNLTFARSCDIPHIRSLARHATEPRERPRETFDSLWERRLFEALRGRGLDPKPQYPVGRRYLDFALFHGDVKLDVEVDGRTYHTDPDGNRKASDRIRDREMIVRGWKVRRFWVSELDLDMEKCLDLVDADLGRR